MEYVLAIVLEIADGIHLIRNPHRSYFVSSCLIVGEGLALVDAGREESPEQSIYPYIRGLGREPSEISLAVLTHAHWDHCGGLARIVRDTGCDVAVHRLGRAYLVDPGLSGREREERFPGVPSGGVDFEAVEPDVLLSDGSSLNVDGRHLRVVHTPGHSTCSCCIVDESEGVYVAGDSVQGRGEARPLIFHSIDAYVESMRRLLGEPIEALVNGHPFPPSGKAVLRGEEIRVHIEESLRAVEELRAIVLTALKGASAPISLPRLHEETGAAPPLTIGCVLEALEAEELAERKKSESGDLWLAR
jgi:glyoxylase-like metal-dependent hydrolase (beta-lactamase superfamily II)